MLLLQAAAACFDLCRSGGKARVLGHGALMRLDGGEATRSAFGECRLGRAHGVLGLFRGEAGGNGMRFRLGQRLVRNERGPRPRQVRGDGLMGPGQTLQTGGCIALPLLGLGAHLRGAVSFVFEARLRVRRVLRGDPGGLRILSGAPQRCLPIRNRVFRGFEPGRRDAGRLGA